MLRDSISVVLLTQAVGGEREVYGRAWEWLYGCGPRKTPLTFASDHAQEFFPKQCAYHMCNMMCSFLHGMACHNCLLCTHNECHLYI